MHIAGAYCIGVFRSCMAATIMAKVGPFGTLRGTESACISYVATNPVYFSER